MKRVVTGPNGIMTVYGSEHLSDDELKVMAQHLAEEQKSVISTMRSLLYRDHARPKARK